MKMNISVVKNFKKNFIVLLVISISLLMVYYVILNTISNELGSIFFNLTTYLSLITALTIPFIMKNLEKEKEKEEELLILKTVLNKVKNYLIQAMEFNDKGNERDKKASSYIPFLSTLFNKNPLLIYKLGIDVCDYVKDGEEHLYLEFLEMFRLTVGWKPRLIRIKDNKVLAPTVKLCESILLDMLKFAKTNFDIGLDKSLANIDYK
ncbi:MAG: hypothetical protein BAJALOKI2v1_530022 [Promethearchaeota archaeon]|nr:MAG: hypothetical protein BAJALOKI2v1_530022 [Candidatus Lokiarchaeota archaeon]